MWNVKKSMSFIVKNHSENSNFNDGTWNIRHYFDHSTNWRQMTTEMLFDLTSNREFFFRICLFFLLHFHFVENIALFVFQLCCNNVNGTVIISISLSEMFRWLKTVFDFHSNQHQHHHSNCNCSSNSNSNSKDPRKNNWNYEKKIHQN